jgi:hypothetical protein
MAARQKAIHVYLERGDKKTFAGALDWPGWCRSGKSEGEAVDALLAYAPRYAKVARSAGVPFTAPAAGISVDIVEKRTGGGGTDFGVPGMAPSQDSDPLKGKELARQRALLEASWKAFDAAARSAEGRTLRTGPRGGGRSVPKMTDHVLEAEIAYLAMLGSRLDKDDAKKGEMASVRRAVKATLRAVAEGRPIANPRQTKRPWSPRYFVRRSAWHALDHAWEIEDRLED